MPLNFNADLELTEPLPLALLADRTRDCSLECGLSGSEAAPLVIQLHPLLIQCRPVVVKGLFAAKFYPSLLLALLWRLCSCLLRRAAE
jgi:hypothetical protein